MLDEKEIFAQVGEEGFTSMVTAFYRRVKTDEILAPMYPDQDWEGAEKRLCGFLLFRLGGDMAYIEERGHPRLRMRHAPFAIGTEQRDRWLKLMGEAMDEVETPSPARESLDEFFAQVADFLRNRPY